MTTKAAQIRWFTDWIEKEINPWRVENNLPRIEYDEQMLCLEILNAFHTKMRQEGDLFIPRDDPPPAPHYRRVEEKE